MSVSLTHAYVQQNHIYLWIHELCRTVRKLSVILFNVYMDHLSVLNASNSGGDIGDMLVDHLCYADDICLTSLPSVGMQQL